MATRYIQIDISHLQDPQNESNPANKPQRRIKCQKRPDIPTPLGANKYASMLDVFLYVAACKKARKDNKGRDKTKQKKERPYKDEIAKIWKENG